MGGFSIVPPSAVTGGYSQQLLFEGRHLATVVSILIFLGGVLFAPSKPLVRVHLSRVFFLQGLLVVLIQSQSMVVFLATAVLLFSFFIISMRYYVSSLPEDDRGALRSSSFSVYHAVTITLLLAALILRGLSAVDVLPVTAALQTLDLVLLSLGAAVAVGLFPFHGWVIPFLGAPRSTVFLPMMCIQAGMLLFFRLYMPIVAEYQSEHLPFLVIPVLGLVYAALLFFGERRLKRIPGYLYISHVCLMAVCVTGLGHLGTTVSLLDGVNVAIAVLGLMGVCSLLTSRFGVRGVLSPTGLGHLFPELAVCYLICVLSLVGFPGTLGFIEEEVMLGQGVEHHHGMVGIIAIALTLNGFSSFRLFARIFYGQPFEGRDVETRLTLRERSVILVVLAALVVNGLAPSLLVDTLTDLAS
jgi:NADH-quinone oxidoreductase subunit M